VRLSDLRRLADDDFEFKLTQVARQEFRYREALKMLDNRFQVRVVSEINRESVKACERSRAGTNAFPIGGEVALMNTAPKRLLVGDVFAYILQASSLSCAG